jgi:hypothetical protein
MSNLKKALEIILESDQINLEKLKLTPFSKHEKVKGALIVHYDRRYIVLKEIDGVVIPFYYSSGLAKKENVPSQHWYALAGIADQGWLIKIGDKRGSDNIIVKQFFIGRLQTFAKELNSTLNQGNFNDWIKIVVDVKDDYPWIYKDVNQSFFPETQIEDSSDHENIIKRCMQLYEKLGVKEEIAKDLLINALFYDAKWNMPYIKTIFNNAKIDISDIIKKYEKNTPSNLQQFEKDLSNINGENQNIDAIVKALQYVQNNIQNNNVTDFEVSFKKGYKEVILKVESENYFINNIKIANDFDFKSKTLEVIATLIISQF